VTRVVVVLGLWVAGVALLAVAGGLASWLWAVDPWGFGALVVAAWVAQAAPGDASSGRA
jgi:hypothetical protein